MQPHSDSSITTARTFQRRILRGVSNPQNPPHAPHRSHYCQLTIKCPLDRHCFLFFRSGSSFIAAILHLTFLSYASWISLKYLPTKIHLVSSNSAHLESLIRLTSKRPPPTKEPQHISQRLTISLPLLRLEIIVCELHVH
jgi:hypothetical protein